MRNLFLIAVITMAAGCQSMEESQHQAAVPEGLILCPEIRPQVCTREYRPVCAWLPETRQWKTYATGCVACSDKHVLGYKEGACEDH